MERHPLVGRLRVRPANALSCRRSVRTRTTGVSGTALRCGASTTAGETVPDVRVCVNHSQQSSTTLWRDFS